MSSDAPTMKLSPTDMGRDFATASGCFVVALPPTLEMLTATGCVLWQGIPAAGTVMLNSVAVAAFTVTGTPATVTALAPSATKFAPVIVAIAPGVSVAGEIDAIVGGAEPAGAVTTTAAVAVIPSHSAVIVVVPGLSAASLPFASTVATTMF